MKKKQLQQVLRIAFIMASIASLFFVPWVLVRAWITPLPDTVQEQLDDAIGYGLDGMIVYVQEADKPPVFYAAGWKNRENKVPADPQSLFKIASISKLYVAVAITRLVHDQRLSLDETLAHYFPELVGRIENADNITLRMMVKHRSGIPNLTDNPDFPWENPPKSSRESLEYALDQPADFAPDADYEYSNTNYLLLSELIDIVVGYPHFQYIKEEILTPLHLTNTFGSFHDVDLDDMMSGYFVGYDGDLKTQDLGSMVATAEDVGIFLRALNDGSVFRDGEQAIYSSLYEYEHTGLLPGYSSIARYHKDMDMVVVQFANSSGGYTWNLTEIVYRRVMRILRSEKS